MDRDLHALPSVDPPSLLRSLCRFSALLPLPLFHFPPKLHHVDLLRPRLTLLSVTICGSLSALYPCALQSNELPIGSSLCTMTGAIIA